MKRLSDQSEDRDLQDIALAACIAVCEMEGELLPNPTAEEPNYEAAATVWLLAQSGCSLAETSAYVRGEKRWAN